MSLLTHCPACNTYYRVVQDQLRISDGWVKCGQCGDIFDASQNLIEMAASAVTQLQPSEDPANHDAPSSPERQEAEQPPGLDCDVGQSEPILPESLANEFVPIGSLDTMLDVTLDKVVAHEPSMQGLLHTVSVDDDHFLGTQNVLSESDLSFVKSGVETDGEQKEATQPSKTKLGMLESESVSFLKLPVERVSRTHRTTRAVFWLCGLLLTLALFAQVVFQNRDLVAAKRPEFKPMLSRLCEMSGCSIRPYQQIESLIIDSASFERLNDGVYRLGLVLKNTSDMPLGLPSIELTLTDAQEQPLFRRAFTPAELAMNSIELGASTEWVSNVALKLALEPKQARVLGYRLVAFYP